MFGYMPITYSGYSPKVFIQTNRFNKYKEKKG